MNLYIIKLKNIKLAIEGCELVSLSNLLNNKLFYYFILFPFFKPGYFETIGILDMTFNIWRILASGIIILIYIKNNKVSKFMIYLFLFQFMTLYSTIVNNGDIIRGVMYVAMNLGICSVIELGLMYNKKVFVETFYNLVNLIIWINFILFIIFPNGIYTNAAGRGNFINIDNLIAPVLMVGILISIICSYIKLKKVKGKYLITIIISVVTIVLVWPATAIVALFGSLVLIIFNKVFKKLYRSINIYTYLAVYILSFFGFVVFKFQDKFSFIIENLLGKSLTFSGRTIIWDNFIEVLKQSEDLKWIGGGVQPNNILYVPRFGMSTHLHNQMFNIILESGFIGLFMFVIMIAVVARVLYKNRELYLSKVLSSILFGFFILTLMEICRDTTMFIAVLAFSYSVGYLKINIKKFV